MRWSIPTSTAFARMSSGWARCTARIARAGLAICALCGNARQRFQQLGCTATDHGHPTASTADLDPTAAAALFARVIAGHADADEHELFRAQMLTEMARMSLEDGLVMQIHPGSRRNHNRQVFTRFGRDVGADIPMPTEYVHALQPLLERFGNEASLTIILFTLDESTYSRELPPWRALPLSSPGTTVVVLR